LVVVGVTDCNGLGSGEIFSDSYKEVWAGYWPCNFAYAEKGGIDEVQKRVSVTISDRDETVIHKSTVIAEMGMSGGKLDLNGVPGTEFTVRFADVTPPPSPPPPPPPPPPNMFTFTVMGPDDWDFRSNFSAKVDGRGMPCHFDLYDSPPTCTVERNSDVRVEGHLFYGSKSYLVELCSANLSEVFYSATVVDGGMFLFSSLDYMVQPDVDFEFVLRVTEV